MTRDEILLGIEEISKKMKGPLLPIDRACLHQDRKDLRRWLAEMDSKKETEMRSMPKGYNS